LFETFPPLFGFLEQRRGVSMKVIIHDPSLPLLLVAIVLDLPVVKGPAREKKPPAKEQDSLKRTPAHVEKRAS
jgi:hypothetical protein